MLDHPRTNTSTTPTSRGAVEASERPGNIRADDVLPSRDLPIRDAQVFWPTGDDPLSRLTGSYPFPTSDHRLVWVDTKVGGRPHRR
ncbi:MAG: hypothetical protein ACTMHL_00575 [Janibacter sp.]